MSGVVGLAGAGTTSTGAGLGSFMVGSPAAGMAGALGFGFTDVIGVLGVTGVGLQDGGLGSGGGGSLRGGVSFFDEATAHARSPANPRKMITGGIVYLPSIVLGHILHKYGGQPYLRFLDYVTTYIRICISVRVEEGFGALF